MDIIVDDESAAALEDFQLRMEESLASGFMDRSLVQSMLHFSARVLAEQACLERESAETPEEVGFWQNERAIIESALAHESVMFNNLLEADQVRTIDPADRLH